MRVIYSKINLFTLNQPIYMADTETGEQTLLDSVPVADMPQWFRHRCYEYNIFNVRLDGNEDYLNTLEMKILEEEIKQYGEAKIRVEVNI